MDEADRDLWQAWRARRDERAFETLVRPHLAFARDLAARTGLDRAEADDVLQETLVRLAQERGERPVEVGLRAWIGRVVTLRARTARRAAARRRRRERRAAERRGTHAAEPRLPEERTGGVERALQELPDAWREAVVLRVRHDLDYAEVARVLGVSENACRVRVHRGLTRLRERLGEGAPALVAALPLVRWADPAAAVRRALGSSLAPATPWILGGIAMKTVLAGGTVVLAVAGAWYALTLDPETPEPEGFAAEVPRSEPPRLLPAAEDLPAAVVPIAAGEPPETPRPALGARAELVNRIYASGGAVAIEVLNQHGWAQLSWLKDGSALGDRPPVGVRGGRGGAVDWVPDLVLLEDLRHLELDHVEAARPALEALPVLPRVTELRVDRTSIDDASLVHLLRLPGLVRLHLDHTRIAGPGLAHLAGLSSLQDLKLSQGRIDDAGLAGLAGLVTLRELDLHETRVTDAGLVHLARLERLEELDLRGTRIRGEGLAHLVHLPLVQVELGGSGATDEALRHLGRITTLEELDLERTAVTDAGLASLSGHARLEKLELGGTRVTDDGLVHLRSLQAIRSIDLQGTSVTDVGGERLREAHPRARIRW